MTDNFLRQLCYTIEQEYWKRYMDDYSKYGDSAVTTRKRWEEWCVADDITKQLIDALGATREEASEDLYARLENLVNDVCTEVIVEYIGKDRLRKWCDSWRSKIFQVIVDLQKKEVKDEPDVQQG